jgi:hypothetical protein
MSTKRNILLLLVVMMFAMGGMSRAEWAEPLLHSELNYPDISGTDPFLSDDGLTIYYSRHRWLEDTYDLTEAYRDIPEGPFTSKRILTELYTGNKQLGPWVSNDQLRLYYCEWVGAECLIMMAERSSTDDTWTYVRTFDEIHTDGVPDAYPSLMPDELTMFYRRGPGTDKHIWVATRPSLEEPFTDIVEVSELNGACGTDDGASDGASILPDGLTIYFNCKGDDSDQDIYKATRSSVGEPFGDIQLLEFCVPDRRESSPYVTPDERTIYYRGHLSGWGIYFTEKEGAPDENCLPM